MISATLREQGGEEGREDVDGKERTLPPVPNERPGPSTFDVCSEYIDGLQRKD